MECAPLTKAVSFEQQKRWRLCNFKFSCRTIRDFALCVKSICKSDVDVSKLSNRLGHTTSQILTTHVYPAVLITCISLWNVAPAIPPCI